MPVPANLVHQLTTGTGTGNLPLTAVPGKQTFGAAFPAGTANECDYFVSHRTAAEWEYGTAHVTAGALVRDTVIGSSNANAAVNFSAGDKDVTNDIPAAKQVTTDTVQTLSNKTFDAPALGTPVSANLANCTGLPTTGLVDEAVTYAKMQNISATARLLGRKTAAAGDPEECTLSEVLDFVGSAARGDLLVRGAATWARKAKGTAGQVLVMDADDPVWADQIAAIPFVIDGGGVAITTGVKGDLTIPFACTILEWTLLGDQSGSIVVDVWKDTYANFPPTIADVITASAKPTISATTKDQSSTLTGWTTTITAGDTLRYNVNSATTIQRATLSLKVRKT